MPGGSVIQWNELLESVNGDQQVLSDVIEAYYEESRLLLRRMRTAIGAEDPGELEFAAHRLKSSLLFFGAKLAGELAFQLEIAGKNAEFASANKLFDELKKWVQPIEEALSRGPDA